MVISLLIFTSTLCWVAKTGARGYVDNDYNIHPRRPSSHRLLASEIITTKCVLVHFGFQ
jgi:hypothetical protein